MSRERYSAELLIGQLRQAEILVSGGKTIAEVVRQLNISEQTYYRRRKEYGGLDVDQARRLSVWLRTRPWISPFSRRRLGFWARFGGRSATHQRFRATKRH